MSAGPLTPPAGPVDAVVEHGTEPPQQEEFPLLQWVGRQESGPWVAGPVVPLKEVPAPWAKIQCSCGGRNLSR